MTDGPFYPARAWREQWSDWDADLSRVQRDGRTLEARGELLGLELQVQDADGGRVDGAEVEIWRCDALAAYRHPRVRLVAGPPITTPASRVSSASRSDRDGMLRFRGIKPPVPLPRAHAARRTPRSAIRLSAT